MFCNDFPTLYTERLTLQEIKMSNTTDIFKIYSDPEVARYDAFTPINTFAEAANIIIDFKRQYDLKQGIRWGIAVNSALIGTCGLFNFNHKEDVCEIGFGLICEEWHKGYMLEALKSVLFFGFNGLHMHRIDAYAAPQNFASVHILEKLSFKQVRLIEKREFFKGSMQDEIYMTIHRQEYIINHLAAEPYHTQSPILFENNSKTAKH